MTPDAGDKARQIATARRVAFFAHHDIDDIVDPYVLHYLRALVDAGFTIVLLTTSRLPPTEVAKLDGLCADVIVRENAGLDFGGWAEARARYPDLSAEFLLLCNDSVYGPFWDLSAFIDDLTSRLADFYGTVLSLDQTPKPHHLQSWFLLFRPSAYRSEAFAEMISPVPPTLSKLDILRRYEFQLTHRLERAGLTFRAAFDPRDHGRLLSREPVNAAYVLWDELLVRRLVPFLKIGLLRDRPVYVRGLGRWSDIARALDAHAAELARANLERRARARPAVRFERAREFAFAMLSQSAHLPIAKRLLVSDMDRAAGVKSGPTAPVARFDAVKAVHGLFRRPYNAAYRSISRLRRGREA